jgi:sigma-B regulation protein RsbU (phosphoserine phosphatase)
MAWEPHRVLVEGFRGHAALPLLVKDRPVGVLVTNQRQARLLDDDELASLGLIANQAALAIEEARLLQEEVRLQVLDRELAVGQQIQMSLLPYAVPSLPGWDFAAYYQPAQEVGGDFYDFFRLPGDPERQGMVIGDVTGKGIPAALFMARSSSLIRSAALQASNPSTALKDANDLILMDRSPELYLTAAYATVDVKSGRVVYANAGHCRPLLLRTGTADAIELDARGTLMGAFDVIQIEERAFRLEPGDLLVLYSDGVTEAMGRNDEQFGVPRLRSLVERSAGAEAREVVEAVANRVRSFSGDISPSDDLTVLAVRRLTQDS